MPAAAILGERLGPRRVAAIGAAIAGVVVVALSGGELRAPGLGDVLVLTSTGCFAAFVVLGRRAFTVYGTLPVLAGMAAWGTAALLPVAAVESWLIRPAAIGTADVALVVYLGAGCSALTYAPWGHALRHAAGRLIGAADALDARTGSALWPADHVLVDWCLARLEKILDPADFYALRHAGGSLTEEQAVAEARLVAATVLGEERVTAIWQETGAPVPSLGRAEVPPAPPPDKAGTGLKADHDDLTHREREVLNLIRQRMSDVEIAARFGVSPPTAKMQVAAVLAKLGVANRRDAAVVARFYDELAVDAGVRTVPAGSSGDVVGRAGLTPRELAVLQQLVGGRTDREIAEHLFISHRTVSKHVEAILAKLGVRSRGAAVAEAMRQGLVPTFLTSQEQ